MRDITIFSKSEKNLEVAIAFMHEANKCRELLGVEHLLTKIATRKFHESIPTSYHADFGLFSNKYCITHPKYGTIAMWIKREE